MRDRDGHWRSFDIALATGGSTRLYAGRGRPPAQVQMEITGKRLQKVIDAKNGEDDIFYRRRDNVVLINRKPLAKLREVAGGAPLVLWNPGELLASGLDKAAFVAELAAAAPGGAADVEWAA